MIGPQVHRANQAVSAYAEANTVSSLSADGDVVSTGSISLRPGTYRVDALVRTTASTAAANPGQIGFMKDGAAFSPDVRSDLRPTANTQFNLFGIFTHVGGSVTIKVRFYREAGTTTFGLAGNEARFGQKILVQRIGD